MAYATSNPPALVSQRVGASGGALWMYKDGDPLATVLGSGYITDGDDLGMVAGDAVVFIDSTDGNTHLLNVTSVTAGGAATLATSIGGTGPVTSLTTATKSVTAAENGATFLLNRAAGVTITLPAPEIGLRYRFLVQTSVTSNDYGIDTDGASTFFIGAIGVMGTADAIFAGDGTADVSINQNGSTTGGLIGSYIEIEAISATLWRATGQLIGSGTAATPFA